MTRRPVAALALGTALVLGGCDGGLFGTGGGDDADAAAIGGVDAAPPSAGGGFEPVGSDGDAVPAEGSPTDGADAPLGVSAGDADAESDAVSEGAPAFVNDRVTFDGPAPLLRVVNVSTRPVRIAAGELPAFTVDGGAIGAPVALAPGTTALAVSDAALLLPLDGLVLRLEPGTLTTLVVSGGGPGDLGDAGTAVPLITDAGAPDGGVAALRVVVPGATADTFAALELRPAGEDPGGAATDFEADASIASAYEILTPGDYALVGGDGAAVAAVSLSAGRTYTLVLGAPTGGDALLVIDSDLPPGALRAR